MGEGGDIAAFEHVGVPPLERHPSEAAGLDNEGEPTPRSLSVEGAKGVHGAAGGGYGEPHATDTHS